MVSGQRSVKDTYREFDQLFLPQLTDMKIAIMNPCLRKNGSDGMRLGLGTVHHKSIRFKATFILQPFQPPNGILRSSNHCHCKWM